MALLLLLEELVVTLQAGVGRVVDLAVIDRVQSADTKMEPILLQRLGQLDLAVTVLVAALAGAIVVEEGVQLGPEAAAVVRIADAESDDVVLVLRLRPAEVQYVPPTLFAEVELTGVDSVQLADADVYIPLMVGRRQHKRY
jgi:hypothetical protein